jgi:hypothetical protein
MIQYSGPRGHYASLAKLLNCLIALLLFAAFGFAALPSFIVIHGKPVRADRTIASAARSRKPPPLKKTRNRPVIVRPVSSHSKVSGTGEGKGAFTVAKMKKTESRASMPGIQPVSRFKF